MASILTLILHGWLLREEKHVEVGYISEAHSMLSCLFFHPFSLNVHGVQQTSWQWKNNFHLQK